MIDIFSDCWDEIRVINKKYNLDKRTVYKVQKGYNNGIQNPGNFIEILDYLYDLLEDYGYTKEEFEKYIDKYSDILYTKPVNLKRMVLVLSYLNLLDEVLFRNPYVFLRNSKLNYNDVYVIGKKLSDSKVDITYESVFHKQYDYNELMELKKKYSLDDLRFLLLNKLFECKREKRKEEMIKLAFRSAG